MVYNVVGLSGPIATAGADECMGALWNPGSRRIRVTAIALFLRDFMSTANDRLYVARISARGTPGSTVTPDADNASDLGSAPPSGTLLDLAEYTVQPTIASPTLFGPLVPASGGGGEASGFYVPIPRALTLAGGSGLGIFMTVGEAMGGTWETSFEFDD